MCSTSGRRKDLILTPTLRRRSPTMLSAEIRADGVSAALPQPLVNTGWDGRRDKGVQNAHKGSIPASNGPMDVPPWCGEIKPLQAVFGNLPLMTSQAGVGPPRCVPDRQISQPIGLPPVGRSKRRSALRHTHLGGHAPTCDVRSGAFSKRLVAANHHHRSHRGWG